LFLISFPTTETNADCDATVTVVGNASRSVEILHFATTDVAEINVAYVIHRETSLIVMNSASLNFGIVNNYY